MFPLNSINFLSSINFLREGQGEDSQSGAGGKDAFPEGRLSSAAWEGWWLEDAA